MNIEETNKVLWKYSKKKATYELQKEKGLSFNDDDYEASVICDYLLELVAYNNYQKEEIERLNKQVNRLNNILDTLMQDMTLLNATGKKEIKPKYVFDRIAILRGVDKE